MLTKECCTSRGCISKSSQAPTQKVFFVFVWNQDVWVLRSDKFKHFRARGLYPIWSYRFVNSLTWAGIWEYVCSRMCQSMVLLPLLWHGQNSVHHGTQKSLQTPQTGMTSKDCNLFLPTAQRWSDGVTHVSKHLKSHGIWVTAFLFFTTRSSPLISFLPTEIQGDAYCTHKEDLQWLVRTLSDKSRVTKNCSLNIFVPFLKNILCSSYKFSLIMSWW